jgi:hypothetical protein
VAKFESICADCGGYDIEWMYRCHTHKGVEYCRGCSCPYCDEEAAEADYDCDYEDETTGGERQ